MIKCGHISWTRISTYIQEHRDLTHSHMDLCFCLPGVIHSLEPAAFLSSLRILHLPVFSAWNSPPCLTGDTPDLLSFLPDQLIAELQEPSPPTPVRSSPFSVISIPSCSFFWLLAQLNSFYLLCDSLLEFAALTRRFTTGNSDEIRHFHLHGTYMEPACLVLIRQLRLPLEVHGVILFSFWKHWIEITKLRFY